MSNVPAEVAQQLSLSEELDKTGDEHGIERNENECDTDYAERIIYELSVDVENLWSVQDRIHELISASE